MNEKTTSELLEAAGLKIYPITEIATLREEIEQLHNALSICERNYEKYSVEIKQLYEVLKRLKEIARKGTHLNKTSELITVLAAIHSEVFVVLKD